MCGSILEVVGLKVVYYDGVGTSGDLVVVPKGGGVECIFGEEANIGCCWHIVVRQTTI